MNDDLIGTGIAGLLIVQSFSTIRAILKDKKNGKRTIDDFYMVLKDHSSIEERHMEKELSTLQRIEIAINRLLERDHG